MRHPLFIVLILIIANISFGVKLETLYEWKHLNYTWINSVHMQNAIKSGNYNPRANILMDMDRAPDDRMFVTVLKDMGVPASLTTISNITGPDGRPLLSPYPDWSWHNSISCSCNSIISVYRVHIKSNHLFFVDTGRFEDKIVCPPKLLIFNLKTNSLIDCVTIPPYIASNKNGTGLFVTSHVYMQNHDDINNATVFMADTQSYGLVTFSKRSGFCRFESNFMKPTNPNFYLENRVFYLPYGIHGLTTIDQDLYYTPLAGREIFKINMRNLQKYSNITKIDNLTQSAGTLSGQTGPIASTQNALFFSNIPKTAILCADSRKKFSPSNAVTIVQNFIKLQSPTGLKVTNSGKELLIGTNRAHRAFTVTLNLDEINFRILQIDIMQIWEETDCFGSHEQDSLTMSHKLVHHVS